MNFMKARDLIKKTEIFQLIQQIPKGAALHVHHKAMVDGEWVYNATFRENLYIQDVDGRLRLHFFGKHDSSWQLLSQIRTLQRDDTLEKRIRGEMTMIVLNPEEMYPNSDAAWSKFQRVFKFLRPFLNYRPLAEDHFYQGLLEFYEDNVMYMEVRSGLSNLYDLNGRIYNTIETAGIFQEVANRFKREHPDFIGAKIIYSKSKRMGKAKLKSFLDEAIELKRIYPEFIAGVDLVGRENPAIQLNDYYELLSEAEKHIDFFFHAGETQLNDGTVSSSNVDAAIRHHSKRIGHAYSLSKEIQIIREFKKKNIPVEVCPISNQVLGLVKDLYNHQASVLFALDIPVVISSDDPGMWGAKGLSYDFYETYVAIMEYRASFHSLKKIAKDSIIYSVLSADEKVKALKTIDEKWDQAIRNHINFACNHQIFRVTRNPEYVHLELLIINNYRSLNWSPNFHWEWVPSVMPWEKSRR
ncbi:adenosine deaminase CECR1-A-like isoform X2 [Fopius arisanus]|nr:PREDICTED: adenosine deaminase CECR1-A-like isoform X2 [Fopius arisanus]